MLKIADVLALPAIVLRNDHQDALGVGLGVTEFAPCGKSAEEIRGLWQWVWARLSRVFQPDAEAPHAYRPTLPAVVLPAAPQLRLRAAVPLADAPAALHAAG
jgi:hypothetical protein